MQCSISLYPQPEYSLPMLDCSFKSLLKGASSSNTTIKPEEQVEKVFSTCATKNSLDFGRIQACYNNEEKATERQLTTSMFTPVHRNCVPEVEINERRIDVNRSLLEEICKAYDGTVPKHCEKANIRTRKL